MGNTRVLLTAIGLLCLCGFGCTSVSWWVGLSPETQIGIYGRLIACWTCGGGPLAGAVGLYLFQRWQRTGFRRGVRAEL
jgi:hypothetical protein